MERTFAFLFFICLYSKSSKLKRGRLGKVREGMTEDTVNLPVGNPPSLMRFLWQRLRGRVPLPLPSDKAHSWELENGLCLRNRRSLIYERVGSSETEMWSVSKTRSPILYPVNGNSHSESYTKAASDIKKRKKITECTKCKCP